MKTLFIIPVEATAVVFYGITYFPMQWPMYTAV
jgi:hypothetical protein